MNKNLISLNPVLRFKKIRKGLYGLSLFEGVKKPGGPIIRGYLVDPTLWLEIIDAFSPHDEEDSRDALQTGYDPTNVRDVLDALNYINQFIYTPYHSDVFHPGDTNILVDGKWGLLTLDAFKRTLAAARRLNAERNKFSMDNPLIVQTMTPPKVEIAPLKVEDIPTLTPYFNRRETRDYIRSKGYNPYSFSTLERREVRNKLNNGLGTAFTKAYNRRDVRLYLRNLGINPYSMSGRERRELRNELNNNL